jgi:hypothetical protein
MLDDYEVLMSSSFYKKPSPSEPQPKMRQFDVGNPSEESHYDFEQVEVLPTRAPGYELSAAEREEIQRMRRESAKEPRLGDHARKRIEILANIGRLSKDVDIDGIVFSLRTLKSKEAREATMSIFKCSNDADAAYEIRRQTLAKAIYQIDGQEVEATLGGDDFALKLQLVDDMEDTVVNKLYNEYNALRQEIRTKFGLDTDEQVKAVVDDIKKS